MPLEKGMNSSVLCKFIEVQTCFLASVEQPVWEKENVYKPVLICLRFDLMSNFARG